MISDVVSNNRIGISNATGTEQKNTVGANNDATATLSSLKPGDSIQAKVVSRDGDTVRLQIDGNKYVDAKMTGGINVEPGKNIVFEVRSTTSGITLSPLFTNVSSDPNISKALSMAGLPLNSDTLTMTKSMMQAGMSIDRSSLINMFRDISMYSGANVSDIVDLHRLGLDINENNVQQIENYKNLSYQLGEGMNDVADKLTELVDNLIDNNGSLIGSNSDSLVSAARVFEGMLEIAKEYDFESIASNLSDSEVTGDLVAQEKISDENISAADKALRLLNALKNDSAELGGIEASADGKQTSATSNTVTSEGVASIRGEILSLADNILKDSAFQNDTLKASAANISNESSSSELVGFLKNVISDAAENGDFSRLKSLLGNSDLKDNVLAAIRAQWSITPAEVADKDSVKELYSRLQRQLGEINEALDNAGLKDTAAGNAAGNMGNNLDFLNQVNQMYAYIQLPLKLSSGDDAHGDLYVYSNGKKISAKDGKVSALLHLDMEHLGPLDIYVAMDTSGLEKKVSTQFSVADDSVLDFLSMHMDELTQRLEAKGYSCKAKLSIKGDDADGDAVAEGLEGGISPVIAMTGSMKLAEYSFDVRT